MNLQRIPPVDQEVDEATAEEAVEEQNSFVADFFCELRVEAVEYFPQKRKSPQMQRYCYQSDGFGIS